MIVVCDLHHGELSTHFCLLHSNRFIETDQVWPKSVKNSISFELSEVSPKSASETCAPRNLKLVSYARQVSLFIQSLNNYNTKTS